MDIRESFDQVLSSINSAKGPLAEAEKMYKQLFSASSDSEKAKLKKLVSRLKAAGTDRDKIAKIQAEIPKLFKA